MPITYPLTPPSSPHPDARNVSLAPDAAVAESISPFTFQRQVQEHQGQRWILTVELPPMNRDDAEEWITFLLSLNGKAGTFLYGPPSSRIPRGNPVGTPLVNGVGQTGQDLATDGWTPNASGILLKGDMIQLGTGADAHLHKVLLGADADGSGEATLTLWPNLRTAPGDGDPIITSGAAGLFALMSNAMEWDVNVAIHHGISFAAQEAI